MALIYRRGLYRRGRSSYWKKLISTNRGPLTVLVHDRFGKELVHHLIPTMMRVEQEDDVGESLGDIGLPPRQATKALIDGLSNINAIS